MAERETRRLLHCVLSAPSARPAAGTGGDQARLSPGRAPPGVAGDTGSHERRALPHTLPDTRSGVGGAPPRGSRRASVVSQCVPPCEAASAAGGQSCPSGAPDVSPSGTRRESRTVRSSWVRPGRAVSRPGGLSGTQGLSPHVSFAQRPDGVSGGRLHASPFTSSAPSAAHARHSPVSAAAPETWPAPTGLVPTVLRSFECSC